MNHPSSDIVFTPAVKKMQEALGSRRQYQRMEEKGGFRKKITSDLAEFIARRDSFYLATASADGQPYVQHRGGPPGFLKQLDDHTLALADFSGNRQYISLGNITENDKAQLFLMDYPNQTRVKIWGRAEIVENDPALLARLTDSDYGYKPERALVFHVEAWDINCPQHIKKRFTEDEISSIVQPLKDRIEELEAEVARLT